MKQIIARKERRLSMDRRKYSYAAYVPERRSGRDRRNVNLIQTNKKVAYA